MVVLTMVKARYSGYCFRCYHKIFVGEEVVFVQRKPRHADCLAVMKGNRKINPMYARRFPTFLPNEIRDIIMASLEKRVL